MVGEVIQNWNGMVVWAMTISAGANWTWGEIFDEAERRGDSTYTWADAEEFYPAETANRATEASP